MNNQQERVNEGAQLLDYYMPDWFKRIDVDTLDLASCVDCVLGQLFNDPESYNTGFDIGCEELLQGRAGTASSYGFDTNEDYRLLTETWIEEINKRLSA